MFSRKSTFRSGPPKMMKSSGGDEEAAVVVIVLLMCCVFVAFAGFWYTSRGKKGDSCKKSDETTEYQLDDKLKCKFVKCKIGYAADSTGVCVIDQRGQECQGTDTNATYTTDVSNVCVFASCNTGYQIDDSGAGACVNVEDDGGGGGGGGSTNCVATPNSWGECSVSKCGGGTQSRGYTITTAESNGGLCPERTQTDEQACNIDACYEIADHYVTPLPRINIYDSSNTQKLQEIGWIDCNGNEAAAYFKQGALNRFKFIRPSDTSGQYEFSCLQGINKGNPVAEYFPEQKSAVAAFPDHRAYDLDLFPVDCGEYPISAFKLGGDVSSAWYDFKCATAAPHTGECRDLNTGWGDASHKVVYLDRHDVTCGENEVISKFKLVRDEPNSKFRYDYTCCKMPTPK